MPIFTNNFIKSIRDLISKARKRSVAFFRQKQAILPPLGIMNEIAENITKSGMSLVSKSKSSEDDFSKLGNGLFSFHKDISDLLCLINETAEQIGKEGAQGGINSAGEIAGKALNDLESYRNLVDEKSAGMIAVSENLNKLFRLCDSFEKAAGFFRSVGLNIKIESRRSLAASEMFGFISEEMRPLSEKIIEIISSIREDVETAKMAQKTASKSIASSLAEFGTMAANASETVKKSVNDIENLVALSRNILEKAADNSRNISRQTGEVVMQIQFHDSMRQRIEHMNSALNEAESRLRDAISSGDSPETKKEKMGAAYAIINLQHAQLAAMADEVEEVFQKCRKAFSEIRSSVDSLVNNLQTGEAANSGITEKGQEPFESLKQSFSELSGLMHRSLIITDILQEVTGKAGSTASRLSEYMKTVDRVNTETHLIALNAIIKAAHLGAEGRTLEELAQTLVRLSNQINEIVSDVNIIISDTNKQISKLDSLNLKKDISGKNLSKTEDVTNDSQDYLEKTVRMLSATYDLFEQKKSAALEKASGLSSSISKTVKDLDFIQTLAEDFGKIKSRIEDDLNSLKPWNQGSDSYLAESAGSLTETYTMQQQREIHEKMLVANNESDTNQKSEVLALASESSVEMWDNIELFDSSDSKEQTDEDTEPVIESGDEILADEEMEPEQPENKDKTIKNDDFGDNVELF